MTQAADICILEHRHQPERPRPAVDGLYVCHGHLRELERLIAEMPARHDDLDRPKAIGLKTRGSGHPGLNIDEAAADLRQRMTGVLASWCRLVAEDRGITPPSGPELTRTAPWLVRHVDWCAAHRWVDEMLTELRDVTRQAIGLTDIPARRVNLGEQCLTHADGERCEGQITVVIRGDEWIARCPVCGVDQDAIPYLRIAQRGEWVTTDDAIRVAGVFGIACSGDLLRQWKHRGRIVGMIGDVENLWEMASLQSYLTKRYLEREERGRMSA